MIQILQLKLRRKQLVFLEKKLSFEALKDEIRLVTLDKTDFESQR